MKGPSLQIYSLFFEVYSIIFFFGYTFYTQPHPNHVPHATRGHARRHARRLRGVDASTISHQGHPKRHIHQPSSPPFPLLFNTLGLRFGLQFRLIADQATIPELSDTAVLDIILVPMQLVPMKGPFPPPLCHYYGGLNKVRSRETSDSLSKQSSTLTTCSAATNLSSLMLIL